MRVVLVALACAAALVSAASLAARGGAAADGVLVTRDGDTIEISSEARDAGLRFAPAVTPEDRAWVLDAVARARPEAARLIAEVDGLVELRTDLAHGGGAIGLTQVSPAGVVVSLDLTALNGDAALQRETVVMHELGHVIDFALVPAALGGQLDAGVPAGGACTLPDEHVGACADPAERFADTFAKWALRGEVSVAGAGYGIPAPPSLETWGAPLAALALELDTR